MKEPQKAHPERRLFDKIHTLLKRVTWSTNYIAAIDGLRFVAIMCVLMGHIEFAMKRYVIGAQEFRHILGLGNIGVQFFFAISGFILGLPFAQMYLKEGKKISLKHYYLRRLIRLEPPYVICLLFFFSISFYPSWGNDLEHLLASVFYLHAPIYGGPSNINFGAWSLEVEVQFYLLMPLLAWLFFRSQRAWLRRTLMVLFCVPFMLLQAKTHGKHFPHGFYLIDQIQFFMAGILLADVFVHEWKGELTTRQEGRPLYDVSALLSFASIPFILLYAVELGRFLIPITLFVAYYGCLKGRYWRVFLENRWIAVMGGMCYTVYLYHMFFIQLAIQQSGGFVSRNYWPNFFIMIPYILIVIFGFSAIFYLLFEKPFMILRFGKKSKANNHEVTETPSQ